MIYKNKYSKDELIKASDGEIFGEANGKLPKGPMLMIDRILNISTEGGKYEKGVVLAELEIDPKNWYFKYHFKGDPVMPGCLGLDGFWQLLGFFLTWIGGKGKGRAIGVKDVKFKGQVRPYHDKITYMVNIKKIIKKPVFMVWGDAELAIHDRVIYTAKDLQVGLFESLKWDFGEDPALDPF